jgi:hypothetical protein
MENADISFWWTALDIGYVNKGDTSSDAGYRSQILVPNTKYHNRLFLRRGGDTNWLSTREFAFVDTDIFSPASGTLTVDGNITATGNVSAYNLSSVSANINGTLAVVEKVIIGSYRETTEALEVEGNILATGRIAWNSSRVLKTEIKEHYLSLEKLAQIKPYQYKWKDGRDDLVHVGAIADEVMKPLPETVLTDSLGIHSMDYAQTAFVMAASLTPYVSDHERRIKELEEENIKLKEKITDLKQEINGGAYNNSPK